ncbi:hypothetical protein GPECTOR_192g308 [Gonium pectorale]|uniref:Formamidopyrimidine-DNA glycosylase catalytic domain-containing protein n=1 Tax=Gonium pectorale TaxID=33097 RepID=A0A150FX24_GONPE|nr:hypothetical protein GPECTOR_192g308 [Gonium pectorale]|eukprot:KXZ42162.1 hypothetical protein GPECTOR_192g308 [Gonium pectorale]
MPELPEVEAARLLLERGCVGKRITRVVAADDNKVFEGHTPAEVVSALQGRTVLAARRKGKYMWLELDSPPGAPWPLLHFGMTGGIVVKGVGVTKYKRAHLESDPDEWPPRFTRLELDLEGGGQVAFVDSRRFARIKLQVDPPAREPLSRLGPDALDAMPGPDEFAAAVRRRVARAAGLKIKALLLEQARTGGGWRAVDFLCGIGNWVGDEVLYQSRLHPEQPAASLSDGELADLHAAIGSVLRLAVEAEADSERFPRDWLFHYRWTNKRASSIGGKAIHFVTVGSRTSAFVPAVQKLRGGGGGGSRKRKGGRPGDAEAAAEAAGDRDGDGDGSDDSETEEEEEDEEEAPAAKRPKRAPAAGKKIAAAADKKAAAAVAGKKEEAAAGKKEAAPAGKKEAAAAGKKAAAVAAGRGGGGRQRGSVNGAKAVPKRGKAKQAEDEEDADGEGPGPKGSEEGDGGAGDGDDPETSGEDGSGDEPKPKPKRRARVAQGGETKARARAKADAAPQATGKRGGAAAPAAGQAAPGVGVKSRARGRRAK